MATGDDTVPAQVDSNLPASEGRISGEALSKAFVNSSAAPLTPTGI
jgi:hypothetical protein